MRHADAAPLVDALVDAMGQPAVAVIAVVNIQRQLTFHRPDQARLVWLLAMAHNRMVKLQLSRFSSQLTGLSSSRRNAGGLLGRLFRVLHCRLLIALKP